jgi:hypothetical protein
MFLPGYGPMAIADWSFIVQCHLLVKTWALAYIGAVVETGVLSTLKRLLMESTPTPDSMVLYHVVREYTSTEHKSRGWLH